MSLLEFSFDSKLNALISVLKALCIEHLRIDFY